MIPALATKYQYVQCSTGDRLPAYAVNGGIGIDGNVYYYARAIVNNLRVPGKVPLSAATSKLLEAYIPYGCKEHTISMFEVLTTKYSTEYVKCKSGDNAPDGSIHAGDDGGPSYHARATVRNVWQPGKVGVAHRNSVALKTACIPWNGKEPRFGDFEVLVIKNDSSLYEYVKCSSGDVLPNDSVTGGTGIDGDEYFFARGVVQGKLIPGKVPMTSSTLKLRNAYLPYGGRENIVSRYEILTTGYSTAFTKCKPGEDVPSGAVPGGQDDGPSYHARAVINDVKQPGKAGVPSNQLLKLISACIPWNGGEHRFNEFEVLIIDDPVMDVKFQVNEGKMLEDAPNVIATKTITNDTDSDQSMEFSFSEKLSKTSKFSHTFGASITVGTKFSTGIPIIAQGEISAELSTSTEHTWGKEHTTELTFTSTFPIIAKPNTTVRCEAIVSEGKMDVPYTITFKSGKTSSGTWEGTSAWDLRAVYKRVTVNQNVLWQQMSFLNSCSLDLLNELAFIPMAIVCTTK